MKKFLSKLPVMISFLVVTVLLLGVYVGLLARPVANGMNYTYSVTESGKDFELMGFNAGLSEKITVKTTYTLKVKSSKVVNISMSFKLTGEGKEDAQKVLDTFIEQAKEYGYTLDSMDFFYVRNGNKVYVNMESPVGDDYTEKDFEDDVKKLEEDKDFWKTGYSFEVSAFAMKANLGENPSEEEKAAAMNFKCTGTVVIAVVLGIVELALIAFSALSVVYFVLSKKGK